MDEICEIRREADTVLVEARRGEGRRNARNEEGEADTPEMPIRSLNHWCEEKGGMVYATEKYDGTNVGCQHDGVIMGRRQLVTADTYCKTSTSVVKKADVAAVKRALEDLLGEEVDRVVLYGELMCQPNYYEYSKRGLHGRWFVFGGYIIPHETTRSSHLTSRLAAHGFQVHGEKRVRLLYCEAFRKLVEQHGIEVVPLHTHGRSIAEVVRKAHDWIVSGAGEGVVVVAPTAHSCKMLKLKNMKESSPRHPDLLRSLVEETRCVAQLFTPAFDGLLHDVASIATTVPNVIGKKFGGDKEKEKKVKEAAPPLIDELELRQALESARTKYDDLSAYFAEGKDVKEVGQMLVQEMSDDLALDTPEKRKYCASKVYAAVAAEFKSWKEQA
eukprot:Sspe_Gene.50417::Locus_28027_Transcript_1_1_Confidence_1.000_Length_1297::g.50417::m.50417